MSYQRAITVEFTSDNELDAITIQSRLADYMENNPPDTGHYDTEGSAAYILSSGNLWIIIYIILYWLP
jgi:hypothetical protein